MAQVLVEDLPAAGASGQDVSPGGGRGAAIGIAIAGLVLGLSGAVMGLLAHRRTATTRAG